MTVMTVVCQYLPLVFFALAKKQPKISSMPAVKSNKKLSYP